MLILYTSSMLLISAHSSGETMVQEPTDQTATRSSTSAAKTPRRTALSSTPPSVLRVSELYRQISLIYMYNYNVML